jgi:hypothetical protein
MDIFGAPYEYNHSFDEVKERYKAEVFTEIWPRNEGRRGFGLSAAAEKKKRETGVSESSGERQMHASSVIQERVA